MGDYFQTLVDVEAGAAEAERLALEVRDWLISAGFVLAERTDCVLGADLGHPPGPRAGDVVDGDGCPGWQGLWSNGLDVQTGRTVFDAGQGEPWAAACPHCGTEFRFVDDDFAFVNEAWEPFSKVLGGWTEGRDAVMPCPSCARPVEPAAWEWADDYFALGYLGFTFWNWPPFRAEFVEEFGRRIGGHRAVLIAGKL